MVLVIWDTDRIKNYVFATHRLREIRGASACLDALNEQKIKRIIEKIAGPKGFVYAGGGAAMAILDDKDQAEKAIQEVEREYRHRTQAAEITGAWIEMDNPEIEFGEYARRLNYMLRAIKGQKTYESSWRTSPVLKDCNSCGRYPAAHHVKHPEETFVCSACKIKQTISRKVRDGSFRSRLYQLLDYAHKKNKWQTRILIMLRSIPTR
jgi:CRISPR/Cas system-associated protein Cas10 (large subunit of type III CRISPR-Cas system)